jgi:hypothetical protein
MSSSQTDRVTGVNSSAAIKVPVLAATTAPISLAGLQTVDGVVLAAGSRVLVKSQGDATTNGIYVVSSSAWQRDVDFVSNSSVAQGTVVLVLSGANNGGLLYGLTTPNPINIGSSSLTFAVIGNPTVSSAMAPVVSAPSLSAARTTLGLGPAATAALPPPPRSFIAGLNLSNDVTTPNTKYDVAAGMCVDDTNSAMLSLAAGMVDFTTTGANGLDAGSIAPSTWYHVFAISQAGGASPARLASTSLTPALPSNYTLKRRLGSVKTDASAHLLGLIQDGGYFWWTTGQIAEFSGNAPTASRSLRTLIGVPPGVNVIANLSLLVGGPEGVLLTDPAMTDSVSSGANTTVTNGSSINIAATAQVRTNASQQIGYRGINGNTIINISTIGWYDFRGTDI